MSKPSPSRRFRGNDNRIEEKVKPQLATLLTSLAFLFARQSLTQTRQEFEGFVKEGSVVELRADDATDVLAAALADKKRDTFKWFVVQQNERRLVFGITCDDLHICGRGDKSGWTYHGLFWIKATCDAGCDSRRLPPEQVSCYATLERQRHGFELYIAVPERVGGKPKLSWWRVTSVFAEIPTAPKVNR